MNKFVFIWVEDWGGIYLNNRLLLEGHNIHALDLLQELARLKINLDDSVIDCVEAGEWLYNEGNLPETYEEFEEKQNE